MKKLRITVEGKAYEVTVETLESEASRAASPVSRPTHPSSTSPSTPSTVPIQKAAPAGPKPDLGSGAIASPMAGVILSVQVDEGDSVQKGQLLLILEAMKMENQIMAPGDATVKSIHVAAGEAVHEGQLLIEIE